MEIDLNDPEDFTLENVRKLIASEDDSVHTQFRVTKAGKLVLSRTVGNKEIDDILFRLETNAALNGYVGVKAAQSDAWVTRIYNVVKRNWPKPGSSYIDKY